MLKLADQTSVDRATRLRVILAASGPYIVLILWFVRCCYQPLGHDQLSYLVEAQRFLAGDQIYGPYISETNPPLIIWFSAIPVFIAQHLHLSALFVFRAVGDLLVCASTVWCITIFTRSRRSTTPFAIALAGFGILAIEIRLGAFDFGQREHLLILLLLLYILAVALDATSRLSIAEHVALGIAAGCAIWFKPQDILILVALELFYACLHRTIRRAVSVEFLAFVATAGFILAMVRLMTPLYLAQVVPRLMDVYWALGTHSGLTLLVIAKHFFALMLAGCFFCMVRRARSHDWSAPAALLLCAAAAFVAFAIQHADWASHKYPQRALLELALLCLLIDWLEPVFAALVNNTALLRWAAFSSAAIAMVLLSVAIVDPRFTRLGYTPPDRGQLGVLLDQIKQQTPGATVTVLSTSVPPMAAIYADQLESGSRFAHLWMMPAIIQNERGRSSPTAPFKQLSPERVASLAALQRGETVGDIKHWQPGVVLVELCTKAAPCLGFGRKDIDVLAWFQESPEFNQVWVRYDRQPSIEQFDVYKLAR